MISNLRSTFSPIITLLAKPFSKIDPNILTLLGVIPPVIIFLLIIRGYYLLAFCSFALISLDFLDGAVARMTNKVTAFGGFLDSTLDRIADGIIISAFGFAGIVRWEIVIPLMILSFVISYTRSRAREAALENGIKDAKFSVGIFQRGERIVFIAISLFAYVVFSHVEFAGMNIVEIAFSLFIFLSLISLSERIINAYRILNVSTKH